MFNYAVLVLAKHCSKKSDANITDTVFILHKEKAISKKHRFPKNFLRMPEERKKSSC